MGGGTEPRRGWQQGYPGGHEPCGPAQRGHAEHRPLHRRAAVLLEPRVGSAGAVLKAPAPAASSAANPRYSGESAPARWLPSLFPLHYFANEMLLGICPAPGQEPRATPAPLNNSFIFFP